MRDVWMVADSIVSPLGFSTKENYDNIRAGKSGISISSDVNGQPIHVAAIKETLPQYDGAQTRFETAALHAVQQMLNQTGVDTTSARTIFILSTTKGNIELLEQGASRDRIDLFPTAAFIAKYFRNPNKPVVVSNACISGVMAVIIAKRLLRSGEYDDAIVVGADMLSRFVLSGFQSLQAISPEHCKPFDRHRKGVNLGEAAAALLLTTKADGHGVRVLGGGLSNDANHISGPSRTGEELASAAKNAITTSGIDSRNIDFISAHGTATLYNDEMEAKAFNLISMGDTPLHSLKGHFGHTLGAAGVVELIMARQSLLRDELIPTFGFETLGVSNPLRIIDKFEQRTITTCLKTASGFGGCNAAVVLTKNI